MCCEDPLCQAQQPRKIKVFEVRTSTKKFVFPFSKAEPTPTIEDPITERSVYPEAAVRRLPLHSGRTGTVDVESNFQAYSFSRSESRR